MSLLCFFTSSDCSLSGGGDSDRIFGCEPLLLLLLLLPDDDEEEEVLLLPPLPLVLGGAGPGCSWSTAGLGLSLCAPEP